MNDTYHRFQSLKILAYADRLRSIAAEGEPWPLDWHIYPSNVCNHSCQFCLFIQNGEQANYHVKLPREVLLRAVTDAARHEAVLIHFSGGGEPLLNRHTLEAMQLAQRLGTARAAYAGLPLKVALSTNGSHLTPEIAAQVDYIRVSLNAGSARQHTATNHAGQPGHPGDWDRIIANIRAAVPHKRQDIGLAYVVEPGNVGDIVPFVVLAAELGVDFVHIRPGFYYDRAADATIHAAMATANQQCDLARHAVAGSSLQIFAISEKFDGYWTPRSYHQCHAVWTGITLRATGDFAVCQDRTDLTFGTVPSYRDGASFADVWHSEERRSVVASIHDGPGGQLSACPRCVWNKRNEIIEQVFMRDDMRLALV